MNIFIYQSNNLWILPKTRPLLLFVKINRSKFTVSIVECLTALSNLDLTFINDPFPAFRSVSLCGHFVCVCLCSTLCEGYGGVSCGKEELRQIVDYKQGRSLARYRMNKNRHDGSHVDAFVAFPLVSFSFCLFVPFAP